MMGSDKYQQIKDQGKLIFQSRFLSNLSKVERYEFIQLCHRRTYNSGENIYHQGDPGTGMYFIEKGSVQLSTATSINTEKNIYSHTIESPESFGLFSIGYEFQRIDTAKCVSDCTLLGFLKPDFETLKKRQPRIAVKFMETVAMIAMRQLNFTINEVHNLPNGEQVIEKQFDAYYENVRS